MTLNAHDDPDCAYHTGTPLRFLATCTVYRRGQKICWPEASDRRGRASKIRDNRRDNRTTWVRRVGLVVVLEKPLIGEADVGACDIAAKQTVVIIRRKFRGPGLNK
jgi:hypothetical protein